MPFGIDPKEIQQVMQDIADIKAKHTEIQATLDKIMGALADLNDHGRPIRTS